ncbi:MAG: hypothetical protein ACLQDM_25700 [Bradyrhizobium sp.]
MKSGDVSLPTSRSSQPTDTEPARARAHNGACETTPGDAQARMPPAPVGRWIAIEEKRGVRSLIVLGCMVFFLAAVSTEWIPNVSIGTRCFTRLGAVWMIAALAQWIWWWSWGKIVVRIDQAGIWLREYPEFEVLPWSQVLRVSTVNMRYGTRLLVELRRPDDYWARLGMTRRAVVALSYFGYPRYLVTLSSASTRAAEAVEAINSVGQIAA